MVGGTLSVEDVSSLAGFMRGEVYFLALPHNDPKVLSVLILGVLILAVASMLISTLLVSPDLRLPLSNILTEGADKDNNGGSMW